MIREMPSRDVTVLESGLTSPEPTLGDYLALLWRAKVLLVAAAILAGATMFARSMSGSRVYESAVTFAASQSKIGEGVQGVAAGTASFRPMVESLSTAAAVMHEVGLDKPPNKMRPSEFLEQVMSVGEVRGTNLMRVTVVHTDPVLAATIANRIADHAVKVARKVSATEALYARDMIKEQVDLARTRLDRTEARLRAFRQDAQVDVVRKDVEAQLTGRGGLLDLLVSIAGEKAKLARMEQELAGRPRIDTLKRTIDSEPALSGPTRPGAQSPGAASATQLLSESINEVYQGLDAEVATTRGYLASLEKQRSELVDVRKLGAPKLAILNRLYELESELARRQVEQDLAQRIYIEISQRYEVASLQVVGRSAELSIIDPAVPADRPVSRQVARNTVVAALMGFSLAVAAVLLWHATRQIRRAPAR